MPTMFEKEIAGVTGNKRLRKWKPCFGAFSCVFGNWKKKECKCDDGSVLCPYGRAGIEGTMLVGHTKRIGLKG